MRFLFCCIFLWLLLIPVKIVAQPTKPGYVCVFNEEFNEDLDTDYWNLTHGGSGYKDGYYRPQNADAHSGSLWLYSKKETFMDRMVPWLPDTTRLDASGSLDPYGGYTNLMYWYYSSASVNTFQRFKFGYFEAECQVPEGAGKNSAFWLYGPGPSGGNDEIDFFEIFGNKDDVHIDIHCNSGCSDDFWVIENGIPKKHCEGDWYDMNIDAHSIHKFSAEWDPDGVTFYVDDRRIDRYEKAYGYNQAMIFNVALGGWAGHPDDNYFPSSMMVNYARVYNKFNNTSLLLNNFNDSTYNSALPYKDITISDGNHIVVVPGIPLQDIGWQRERGFMHCYATDFIKINPGFHAELGSDFKAKIISNPGTALKSADGDSSDTESILNVREPVIESEEEFDFTLFPNPNNGKMNILWTGNKVDNTISIVCYNTAGLIVYSGMASGFSYELDISNLPSGSYYIKCILSNKVLQRQFLKL